jgi:predicted amidohydrolase YtcJ
MADLRLSGHVEEVDGRGLSAIPGLVDCHTHACFAGDRVEEFRCARRVRRTKSPCARRRNPLDRSGHPAAGETGLPWPSPST